MKILIIGEYSGFAKNLKIGFQELNHEVTQFSWGDSFKIIKPADCHDYYIDTTNIRIGNITFRGTVRIKLFIQAFFFSRIVKKLTKQNSFDIILILNYTFFRTSKQWWKPFFTIDQLLLLSKNKTKIYTLLCGNDIVFDAYLPNMRKKNIEDIKYCKLPSKSEKELFDDFKKHVPKVIPVMYEYAIAYRNHPLGRSFDILPTIPLPLSLTNIVPSNNIMDKIVIFHGLNRTSKGTAIILEAMYKLKSKFSNVEIVAKGKMPLNEYLAILNKANIVIDQCYAMSYGMNAIYAMAMGKVVLSGNEPEAQKEFGRNDIPIINIIPDAEFIALELEKLVKNPKKIIELSKKSREFVESFHDTRIIAKQYEKLFTEFI